MESELNLAEVLEVGAGHVAIATGSRWRRDGYGRSSDSPFDPQPPREKTFTPDDIMAGRSPEGSVLVYDDEGFYMASLLAEKLARNGNAVYYVTSHAMVSYWSSYIQEQARVHRRLAELGIGIMLNLELTGFDGNAAVLRCVYTGREQDLPIDNIVLVTCRTPQDSLFHQVQDAIEKEIEGAPTTVQRIGDADAPAIIAAAVFAGHRYARELDGQIDRDDSARVDRGTILAPGPGLWNAGLRSPGPDDDTDHPQR
jgi:dimethylamine/trimethylamine dehydrogenase